MLPWINATAASVDSPSPADSSSNGVGAPGRYKLPTPRRTDGNRDAGANRANSITAPPPARAEKRPGSARGGKEIKCKKPVGGSGHSQPDQRQRQRGVHHDQ